MIIASTVPPLINDGFRTYLHLCDSDPFSSWSVWCIPTPRIGEGRSGAVLAGWQFQAGGFDGMTGNITLEQATAPGSRIQLVQGVLPIKVHEAGNVIRSLPQSTDPVETYELRALRFPAQYIEALWLYSLSGTPDWIVPYASFQQDLQEMRPYQLPFLLNTIANAPRRLVPEL